VTVPGRILPRGVVTFMFTDIAGSTRLLQELGAAAYARELGIHRQVIREAAAARDGVEVDTQGDAFFIAFPTIDGAVAAAREITDGLAGGPIRVRIGLHTGQPYVGDEGYVGEDVHLAARIAATAHGGQVVASGSTRAGIADHDIVDLGEHRLKDIAARVSIFQLGTEPFPPLRSLGNSNLPRPASTFRGRDTEVAAVRRRIADGARIVTLTGPGGTGKTRLAIEAASGLGSDFPAGLFWAGCAALRDPGLVLETIGAAVGARGSVADQIGPRRMLIVVDNLEQVIAAGADLAHLVAICPGLTMIVTSRERLAIGGEVELAIPPLDAATAVDLFCERSGLDPTPEIAELCARLDALPLAVELAAARTKVLSPAQILQRLGSRLDLLKGSRDLDPRQQTLRQTIDWSHELLSGPERRLFRRLAVFPGGCTLEVAEEVAGAEIDTLESLVAKSLVRATHERFWMLETIRAYALERLEADDDRSALEADVAGWALRYVERQRADLTGPAQLGALDALDVELDNLRLAVDVMIRLAEPDRARRLVLAGRWWMGRRGRMAEEAGWLEAVLALPGGDPILRASCYQTLGGSLHAAGDSAAARRASEAALELAIAAGDRRLAAGILEQIAMIEPVNEATLEEARAVFAELGASDDLARVAINVAALALNQGRLQEAIDRSDEAVDRVRRQGNRHGIGMALANQATALALIGRSDEAGPIAHEALDAFLSVGDELGVSMCADVQALRAARAGRVEDAATWLGAAAAARVRLGFAMEPSDEMIEAAIVDALGGAPPDAVRSWREAGALLDPGELVRQLRAGAASSPGGRAAPEQV
jgi:predicted ATPase/class 3 adenylate cyclase